jgi:hypothetical protein
MRPERTKCWRLLQNGIFVGADVSKSHAAGLYMPVHLVKRVASLSVAERPPGRGERNRARHDVSIGCHRGGDEATSRIKVWVSSVGPYYGTDLKMRRKNYVNGSCSPVWKIDIKSLSRARRIVCRVETLA